MTQWRAREWLRLEPVQWICAGLGVLSLAMAAVAAGLYGQSMVLPPLGGVMIVYGLFRFFVGSTWPSRLTEEEVEYFEGTLRTFEASPQFEWEMKERDAVIARAKTLPLLDAILAVKVYNGFRLGPRPHAPDISFSEVKPWIPGMLRDVAIMRANRMLGDAMVCYLTEEELKRFKADLREAHPGFSQDSYDAALRWGMFAMH